jgi:EAL domain-containing protein (putative c-di-GMP-specific phosphodiesterase class I)
MIVPADHSSDLQPDLGSALINEELKLVYQPKGRTDDRGVVGFEALVRWHHPKLGVIPPNLFIPIAERSGQIDSIGEWVLREACNEAASWSNPLRIAVNVSALQFRNNAFPALVTSILMRSGLAPRRLELEITETALLEDFSRAAVILAQLKSLGVQITIDDFGIGYSNLSIIQAFTFDYLKIDGSFIANINRLPQTNAIVRAVIGLARVVDTKATAECVETQEQLEFLVREGSHEIQGFLLGRPSAIEAYADIVKPTRKPPLVRIAR